MPGIISKETSRSLFADDSVLSLLVVLGQEDSDKLQNAVLGKWNLISQNARS